MFILHLDIFAVQLDIGLPLVDANDIVVRVKIVEVCLGKSNLRAVLHDDNVVSGCNSATSAVASPLFNRSSVSVKPGEIIVTELLSPSLKKTPGVKRSSTLPV